MPLVITEGPDGSGKSFLCQKLLKDTGHPTLLIKRSGPPGPIETVAFMAKWIADQSYSGLNILCDRHPVISEAIYAPVVRKAPGPHWQVEEAASAMRGKDLLLVYCRTWDASMVAGAHVEEQMEGVHENYGPLVKEYDRWMDVLETVGGIRIHRHDYRKDPNCTYVIDVVKDFWGEGR